MAVPQATAGHFNLLYFAAASSFTKKQSEAFPAPLKATELFDFLEKQHPGFKEKVLNSCMLTVNLEYVDLEEVSGIVIKEGDEVAIIPPVSSG